MDNLKAPCNLVPPFLLLREGQRPPEFAASRLFWVCRNEGHRMESSHDTFLDTIREDVEKGFSFVPLIGSGLSVTSGIPTAQQYGDYLRRCIAYALWPPTEENAWHPRGSPWPDPCDDRLRRIKINDLTSKLPALIESKDAVRWEAIGAMSNWRTALHFLSRLDDKDGEPHLSAPDNRVIDSFFLHITRGRKPNIGHMMLAHLADVLGVHTILTTNFDTLIEDAFAQLDIPLATFDVHQRARLPGASSVLAQRAIVKLHGGRYGLRADFTLDDTPSDQDKETFREYFTPSDHGIARKHLLVLGTAGDDTRTIALIRHALAEIRDMRVYWLCYSRRDENTVRDRFPPECASLSLRCERHADAGLFLFQLYEGICHSPPPGNVDFPAFWPVPPVPSCPREETIAFTDNKTRLMSGLSIAPDGSSHANAISAVVVADGPHGLTSLAASVMDDLYAEYESIWLDLDPFCGWHDCFVAMVDTIARRLGESSRIRPITPSDADIYRKYFAQFARRSARPMLIILNGREPPGRNAGFTTESSESSQPWPTNDSESLWAFLDGIKDIPNCVFLVLTRNEDPFTASNGKGNTFHLPQALFDYRPTTIAQNISAGLQSLSENEHSRDTLNDATRFTYGLTLFRRSRHLAALSSWALIKAPGPLRTDGKDNDKERAGRRARWLDALRKEGAIHYDGHGFVWMHTDMREAIREQIEASHPAIHRCRAECHQGIADWYVKLFRCSNDPLAALESLYHRLCAIRYADTSTAQGCGEPVHLRWVSLVEIEVTLRLARDRILACGYFNAPDNLISRFRKEIDTLPLGEKAPDAFREKKHHIACMCVDLERRISVESASYTEALERTTSHPPSAPYTAWARLRTFAAMLRRSSPSCDRVTLYHQAVYYSRLRQYKKAESLSDTLLEGLALPETLDVPTHQAVAQARNRCRTWLTGHGKAQTTLQLAIKALRERVFLEMLRSQLLRWKHELNATWHRNTHPDRNTHNVRAELLWIMATELMRSVDDHGFLQLENARSRTHYGILLANMGRYSEAHRRLNEAAGYLAHSQARTDPMHWALIDLRRAEVHLLQVDGELRIANQSEFTTHHLKPLTLLNSAHMSLERARQRFVGQRRNIWWWTWLCELQMTVCVYLSRLGTTEAAPICRCQNASPPNGYPPLACSLCAGRADRYEKSLDTARQLIECDPVRQARLVILLREFVRCAPNANWGSGRLDDEKDRLKGMCNSMPVDIDDHVKEYVQEVIKHVEKPEEDTNAR